MTPSPLEAYVIDIAASLLARLADLLLPSPRPEPLAVPVRRDDRRGRRN
ncbi:MAG TPA: hypothetical protein VM899_13510 [Rubellimicrobium sp.]|jgi:hypothetical protein|nr:hypothetical protein [Rubellimicrobium sp.]